MKNQIFDLITSSSEIEPVIIVEMSGNHGNSIHSAKAFVTDAIAAGADVIKFQVYTPDTITLNVTRDDFLVNDKTIWKDYKYLHELYSKAHTPWHWVAEMARQCDEVGQPWFASPFDHSAVDFLESLNCPAYKLASPEINDYNLIEAMAQTLKPIIVSTGLASNEELDQVVSIIKKYNNNFAILKCTSAYPAPIEDLNLSSISYLSERYNCPIGFSDHSKGDIAAIAAVALGATIIEKHFKRDGDISSVDSEFSMNLSELSTFKEKLQQTKTSLGEVTFEIPPSAQPSLSGRRSIYVSKEIKANEIFTSENIKSVRPAFSIAPEFLPKILGKSALVDLKPGDRLTKNIIKDFDVSLDKDDECM